MTTEKQLKPAKNQQDKKQSEVIIEPHPVGYDGFPFITLVQYRKSPMLVIVDNIDDSIMRTFLLDLCGPEGVDEEMIISVAEQWYNVNRSLFPISVEFSKRGLTHITSKIYKALNVEFISRIIGPAPKYPMVNVKSVKRRRRKVISPNMEQRILHT